MLSRLRASRVLAAAPMRLRRTAMAAALAARVSRHPAAAAAVAAAPAATRLHAAPAAVAMGCGAAHALQRCAFATALSSSSSSTGSGRSHRRVVRADDPVASAAAGAGVRSSGSGSVPQYSSEFSPHTVLAFTHNNTDVYVVGTAHISARSADEVRSVMRRVAPDVVMVELDPQRAQRLAQQHESHAKPKGAWASLLSGLMGMRGGQSGGDMLGSGLRMMYDYLRAKGFKPGAEFAVAMEEARARGIEVVFGDQQSAQTMANLANAVTLQRLMQALQNPNYAQKLARVEHTIRQRMAEYNRQHPDTALSTGSSKGSSAGRGGSSAADDPFSLESLTMWVEALKNRDTARMLVELMDSELPELTQALLHDRDRHMWHTIDSLCDSSAAAQHLRRTMRRRTVVAVVGFAHLDGIERLFRRADGANKLHGSGDGHTPDVIRLPPPDAPASKPAAGPNAPDVIHL